MHLPHDILLVLTICSSYNKLLVWFGLWCLTPLLTIFQLYLAEETGIPGKKHRPVASYWQTWSHNVVSSTPRHERGSNSKP